jgi:hypothetical protein
MGQHTDDRVASEDESAGLVKGAGEITIERRVGRDEAPRQLANDLRHDSGGSFNDIGVVGHCLERGSQIDD